MENIHYFLSIVFFYISVMIFNYMIYDTGNPFKMYVSHASPISQTERSQVDPGPPLFLTPYIESGKIEEGQRLSRVGPMDGTKVESYSGYLTVNAAHNSNMFFWFFPAQNNESQTAPLVLWLEGGPGGSSLFTLFAENGPFVVTKDLKLLPRKWAWTNKFSMLYIDNPVGTGFSFTESDAGYAKNEEDVARDLYSALSQLFQLFPQYQKNDFYATGASYAGKYVPAICYKIHMENPNAKIPINLKGIAIGSGLVDPISQFPGYGDLLYNTGQISYEEKQVVDSYTSKMKDYIMQKQWVKALEQWDKLMNGDLFGLWPYPSYLNNVTGTKNFYNFMMTTLPENFDYYEKYVVLSDVRRAIHVGKQNYSDGEEVKDHMLEDVCQSVIDWVVVLANNYRCMFYSAQLDIIVGTPLVENFLRVMDWEGRDGYLKAKKLVWKVRSSDKEVAGYVRRFKDLYHVVVRGGGHMLPYDQPERCFDMIDRFIYEKPFDV